MRNRTFARIPEGLTNAAFTLLGVFISSSLAYFTAIQTASVNSRQSCIARIDTREADIRTRTDRFLVSIASVVNLDTHKNLDLEKIAEASDEVMKSGYSFSVYVDGELSSRTQDLANNISQRLNMSETRNRNPEFQENLSDDFKKSLKDWKESLKAVLSDLEQKRNNC